MASPFFSGRIPQDLFDKIKQHRAETGESTTDVLINALSAYVNHPVVRPSIDVASPKIEERFKLMDERLAILELSFKRFNLENIVIKSDNKKISDAKSNEILTSDIPDNSFDNKYDNNYNNPEKVSEVINNPNDNRADKNDNITANTITLSEDPWPEDSQLSGNAPDNNYDNADNITKVNEEKLSSPRPGYIPAKFENLTAAELTKQTNLKQSQLESYKRRIAEKYQKMGQPLQNKKLLEAPEKVEPLKPIIINGYQYDIFYLGQNEKGKGTNLWSVIPIDN